ncbi:mitotic checkpoint serine/threonine-protein kinase BUB1-like isoform X1 [Schistocerca nitens]|uniref:mitotic checkpoint serine/threonine-protein kinase BUB1-like isoform X1 n=1 Tax=Schistocerca nitens TaxID=7011 RepID=UPI0021180F52|nr:mitotic checkpoint serine/threonine-protein kinase BUB1-like isoform X1 [Schistocerca nitens]
MERPEEILLTGCQEEFPQEILKRCREFLSTHTLDGDDPLEVWYHYIKWAEEHFPESGRTENIQKLLHNCLNKFNSSEEYFQDVRFIKLWLKYAEMAENPLQIYNQLSMCGIGAQCALFYKSWADELFRNGEFKKADKVFREGLKRKAQPFNKLQSAYGNFHIAVARRMLDETKVHTSSGADKWTGCNLISDLRKPESFGELTAGETQWITSNVLKPVENLPSRFATKCPNVTEKTADGKSTEKTGTLTERVERDTKQVSKVQRGGKYSPVRGTRLGNSHNDYKSKTTDGFHCRLAVFEVPNPSQRPRYPKEKVYADNTEYSLEELRAVNYMRKEGNTEGENHSHPVTEICNQIHAYETQRLPLQSVPDKKLEEFPSLGHRKLQTVSKNEENFAPRNASNATGDGIWPTNFKYRNVEKVEHQNSAVSHKHSDINTSTKSGMSNIPPTEILTAVPRISFKETSSGNTYCNQHHEKEHALSAGESNIISQFTTNDCEFPRCNPLLSDAKPDLTDTKETASSASTNNITLRARNNFRVGEKYQVHPSNHTNSEGSGTAVQMSTVPHKADVVCEPGHYATEPEDLKEKLEDNNHFKYEIPFVPSPGMTCEEIEQLKGTENKENEGGMLESLNKCEMLPPAEPEVQDHLMQRICSRAHAAGFGGVDTMYVDKDYFELQPRQSALFSDTCSSQMFAHTLLSSTPARKSIFHLANSNRTKSTGNPPIHARTSEERKLRNMAEEIKQEANFTSHPVSSESKEILNPLKDVAYINKSHAVSEVQNVCPITEQRHNSQSRELYLGHSYRDVRDDINPFDDVLISQLLQYSGFVERNNGGWIKVLCKPTPRIRLPFTLKIDNDIYQVIKEIGKGSYARILCATDNYGERVALKVQKPSWLWEAYIEDQIQHRIKGKNLALCFANPSRVYEYSDGSIMVHEYLKYGSVLNFITEARKGNRAVNENVVFCFMCKIIEAIRSLHSCEIIHGDLKPDNIMVRSVYPPSIQLIDFGRAIDMTLFPPKTTFKYAVTTKDFQCTEMQAKKPWTYQTDIFGLLSTAHCFLFGEYMKVSHKSGKWVIQKSLPRSCHKQLWSQFFHDLLNIESCDKLPDLGYWEAAMQQEIDVTVLNDQLKVLKNAMDGY